MYCISVNFKKAPLQIRQQFAFSGEEQALFLSALIAENRISGGVVLSTCNRSEIYFTGEPGKMDEVGAALSSFKQIAGEDIKRYCLYYQGKKALRHLFKVACGLDSMVLGEDEILRQVRDAYRLAQNEGHTNSELNIFFQGAFNCAKLSKSTTRLSDTPVSIGTLTANAVERYRRENPAASDGVLVIGATGKIGSIVAKNLLAKGIPVIGTSRKKLTAGGLYLQDRANMEWLDFDSRYRAAGRASVIVSATSSPHYTVTREEFLRHADAGRAYLFIDLAVPRDIDRELAGEDNITLLDMDYFERLSKENHHIKLGELEKAEHILNECAEEVLKKHYIRVFKEKMAEKCEEEWFQKMTYYLRDALDSDQLSAVLNRIWHNEKNGRQNGE